MSSQRVKYWVRKTHRWISVLLALQVLAWVAGGLYFSLYPIEVIRGEHLVHSPEPIRAAALSVIEPIKVSDLASPQSSIDELKLVQRHGGLFYRVVQGDEVRLVDARGGGVFLGVDAAQAEAIARQALIPEAQVLSVNRLDSVPADHEYRSGPLPAYQVNFDHESGVRLYIHEATGELVTRRTNRWRIFDFLWMLHVMDYETRDDFNHWLLTLASSLTLFVILSGILLWWQSSPLTQRRKSSARATGGE